MGPVSTVRPVVQVSGSSGQNAGHAAQGGSAVQNGARVAPASAAETARPISATPGAERTSTQIGDQSYLIEAARERAEAAHRAYTMAMLALGQNPLNDPVP